ncbi:MAG: 3-oxoacyl-[acyl-carrier-protein] synthase III C-terminal domain-containing protein [Lacunisphaera sp.]
MKQYFKIVGSARALPGKCVTAEELDQRSGLPLGWTVKHTGVRFRYEAVEPENGTTLGRTVVLEAVKLAGWKLGDMELLVDASLSLQQPIPSNSALLQEALGAEAAGCATMDIHASCMGFVAALQAVNGFFASGAYRRAVIVCAETAFRGVNWEEPESAHLMGDGAAAVVLEACAPIDDCVIRLKTFGEGAQLCRVKGGGHRLAPYAYTAGQHADYLFHMDGKGVHKFASIHLPPMVQEAIASGKTPLAQLHVIPHQASAPSIELLARRLTISRAQLHSSVENHGNLVAAGIPFVLHATRALLNPGARVMLIGTAAGYSQAVAIFTL